MSGSAHIVSKKSGESLKPGAFVLLLAFFSPLAGHSQTTAPIDKADFVQHASSLYYRPVAEGLAGELLRAG